MNSWIGSILWRLVHRKVSLFDLSATQGRPFTRLRKRIVATSIIHHELDSTLGRAVTELGLNYRGLQLAETESMRYDCNEAPNRDFDPARSKILYGAPTFDYQCRIRPGSHYFTFEFPYWNSSRQFDSSESDMTYKEVRLYSFEECRSGLETILRILPFLSGHQDANGNATVQRLIRAVDERRYMPSIDYYERQLNEIDLRSDWDRKATVTEKWQGLAANSHLFHRTTGMVWRAARILNEDSIAEELRAIIESGEMEMMADCEWIPIHKQVALQTKAALISAKLSLVLLLSKPVFTF